MLFKPELIERIQAGEKTETRRLKKPGDRLMNGRTVYRNGRIQFEVGRTYALCPGTGKRSVGRFRLLDIEEQALSEISEPSAIREGFGSRQEFFQVFTAINGGKYTDPLVFALTFELVK